jgi:heterodisulfide reductase subunit B
MKVAFYPGCSYESSAGYPESVRAVAGRIGLELDEIPDWNCCGATALGSLDRLAALAAPARVFALAHRAGYNRVMTVCNACYTTMRKAAGHLAEHPEDLERINQALAAEDLVLERPLEMVHLLDLLAEEPLRSRLVDEAARSEPGPVRGWRPGVYYGCQYSRPWLSGRDARFPDVAEGLLTDLGLDPVDHSAKTICCGSSHQAIHQAAVAPLIDRIVRGMRQAGADYGLTICPLCQFNMDSGQKEQNAMPMLYLTQALALALGASPDQVGLNKLLVPWPPRSIHQPPAAADRPRAE